jgi:hypothetical protein
MQLILSRDSSLAAFNMSYARAATAVCSQATVSGNIELDFGYGELVRRGGSTSVKAQSHVMCKWSSAALFWENVFFSYFKVVKSGSETERGSTRRGAPCEPQ